eukprot:TRINITY_DN34973_c0_g1_i1.p1 TRINITY_DN34973_c0_g1~~TRINITY_DN34973_c0_g1_i1.p1  ORF type:complete len:385 (-),score=23.05 TRINITY_DN34973_c0_g1_i1:525-1679(-)
MRLSGFSQRTCKTSSLRLFCSFIVWRITSSLMPQRCRGNLRSTGLGFAGHSRGALRRCAALHDKHRRLTPRSCSSSCSSPSSGSLASSLGREFYHSADDVSGFVDTLRRRGVSVLRCVLPVAAVDSAHDGVWQHLSSAWGAVRGDTRTWTHSLAAGGQRFPSAGVAYTKGAGQSVGSWQVRGARGVQQAFRAVWQTDELITSMEPLIVWRPWRSMPHALLGKEDWRPNGLGLHRDRHRSIYPNKCCPTVQGLMVLTDSTRDIGGFICCPDSQDLKEPPHNEQCRFVAASAGDLICFDSRVWHGSQHSELESISAARAEDLLRLVVPVCMIPRECASEEVQRWRHQAFEMGATTKHSPHRREIFTMHGGPHYSPPELTEGMQRVL